MINKILLTVAIVLLPTGTALSQSSIKYSYDDAGNRISRSRLNAKSINKEKSHHFKKSNDDNTNVYYSEESDIIVVNFSDLSCSENNSINVYFPDGTLALSEKAKKDKTMVYIGNLPQGGVHYQYRTT